MKIGIYIFKVLINVIYSLFKLFPTKKKIIFLSRQGNKTSIHFNILIKTIKEERPDVKIITSCKKLEKSFKGIVSYSWHMIKEMYHLATSKVAILDTYSITISNLHHKKNLTVIQMWHAMGALKKFGYSILDQEEGSNKNFALLMNMHKNYDYVMTSSKTCSVFFQEAFHVEKEKMFIDSLPIVDRLTDKTYQQEQIAMLEKEYPSLKEKQNILYCPTFRKNNRNGKKIQELIDVVDFKKYNLIIKLHPHSKVKIKDKRVLVDNKHTTIKFAFLSDYIITDYSAIVFELALLNKPLFFYTYDYDKYVDNRNFYIDFKKEMPGLITENPKEIFKCIKNKEFDTKKVKEFRKKYITIPKGGCTRKLLNLIYKNL